MSALFDCQLKGLNGESVSRVLQGSTQVNNNLVEKWQGTKGKQSYSYMVQQNSTTTFMWAFQRTQEHDASVTKNIYLVCFV